LLHIICMAKQNNRKIRCLCQYCGKPYFVEDVDNRFPFPIRDCGKCRDKPTHEYCFSVQLSLLEKNELRIKRTDRNEGFNEIVYDILTTCKLSDRTLDEYLLWIQPKQFGEECADELLCLCHCIKDDTLFDPCADVGLWGNIGLGLRIKGSDLKNTIHDRIVAWLKEHEQYANDDGTCDVFLSARLCTSVVSHAESKRKGAEMTGKQKKKQKKDNK
jgi:hypothetical protein